jgi:sugar (pentulose or hexulose) kinase
MWIALPFGGAGEAGLGGGRERFAWKTARCPHPRQRFPSPPMHSEKLPHVHPCSAEQLPRFTPRRSRVPHTPPLSTDALAGCFSVGAVESEEFAVTGTGVVVVVASAVAGDVVAARAGVRGLLALLLSSE